jgi:two-component system response regulator HydG
MGARLIVESNDGTSVFELDPERPITVGRSRENAIVLADEHASRVHARIQFADGQWTVTDLESRNGTQLDDEPVHGTVPLVDGQEIQVGASRLRFVVDGSATATPGPVTRVIEAAGANSTTHLQADALTALCRFMATAVEETDPGELLRRALRAILKQTKASLAGYLGLDPDDPVPKLVLPDEAKVDQHLSRQLTAQVQQAGKPVWLGADRAESPADSLMSFTDAVGLPVKAGGQAVAAVHVYKANARFDERDVRFCEALVGYLANGLNVIRGRRALEAENSRLRHRAASDELIGDSPAMQQLRGLIARVAPQPTTVLIIGESGTGKELVATALHKQRRPAAGPLVAVNCAAIPPTMMEAELFGYRKGAFSGAERDYPGMFQQADEGTLFLDEVGDLSADSQAKLLRVIETKTFKPLGTTTELKADVRVIAATNRDLESDVRAGRFRRDLYYRLKVVTITVPPLRSHTEDVADLAEFFLSRLAQECRKKVSLTPAALKKLRAYSWPGNVRQLRSVLENAVVMSDCDTIDAAALHLSEGEAGGGGMPLNLEALECWAIGEAMKRTNGNKSAAAELVGISRETLANKLKKYELT